MKRTLSTLVVLSVIVGAARGQEFLHAVRLVTGMGSFKAVADIDGDSDLDIIGGRPNEFLRAWINDGQANFIPVVFATTPQGWTGLMKVTDVTGDGLVDAVVGVTSIYPLGPGLLIYPGLVPGGFGAPVHVATGGAPTFCAESEIDLDGRADLLVGLSTSPNGPNSLIQDVQWMVSGGAPNILSAGPITSLGVSSSGAYPSDLFLDDWNQDGIPDLLRWGRPTIVPYLTSGNGVVPVAAINFTGLPATGQLIPMDLDADGDRDFLAIQAVNASYYGHVGVINNGAGSYSVQALSSGLSISGQVLGFNLVSDLDGDGDQDLLVRTSNGGAGSIPNYYVVYENDGSGMLTVAQRITVGNAELEGVGFFDLNGDAFPDYVGGGEYLLGTGDLRPDIEFPFGYGAGGVTFDVDRDGDLDYLRPDTASYELNDGTGRLLGPGNQVIPVVPNPSVQVFPGRVADLDGDGLLDMLAMIGPVMHSFRGNPKRTFTDLGPTFVTMFPGLSVAGALVGDLDNDGVQDLALNDGVGLSLGNGTYTLILNTWPGFTVNALGDVNGDGALDLQAVRPGSASVTPQLAWWTYNGAGFYTPQIVAESGVVARTLRLADADDDGDLDMVYATTITGVVELVVRANNGGVFGAPIVFAAPRVSANAVFGVHVADLNGDGLTDLAVYDTGYRANCVAVLLRTASGLSYAAPRIYVMADAKTLADVDGDGDLDFIGDTLTWSMVHDGINAGARAQYGVGNPGTGNVVPVLGASGPFRTGSTLVLRSREFVGGAPGILTAGLARTNLPGFFLPGVTTYVWPWTATAVFPSTGGAIGVPGAGTLDVPILIPLGLAHNTFTVQAAFLDSGAAAGVVATNGLEISIGL